jgi:hypothetical protein
MRANLKNNKSDQRIAESFEDSSSGGSSDFGESSSLPCLSGDKTNFRSRIYGGLLSSRTDLLLVADAELFRPAADAAACSRRLHPASVRFRMTLPSNSAFCSSPQNANMRSPRLCGVVNGIRGRTVNPRRESNRPTPGF